MRSQIPVLKKAFTEEQSKNISLCEELKLKDQQLRIAESEADSLNFRNQQLMCRVTVLQDELEALQVIIFIKLVLSNNLMYLMIICLLLINKLLMMHSVIILFIITSGLVGL